MIQPPDGFSDPMRGPVKTTGRKGIFSQDIAVYRSELEEWNIGANGQSPVGIYSLRIGSPIALLNGHGEKPESDTPRVDEAEEIESLGAGWTLHYVHTEFARTLERELSASHAVIRELYEALEAQQRVTDAVNSLKPMMASEIHEMMDEAESLRSIALAHAKEKGAGR